MTSQPNFRLSPPQNVYESYKAIRNSELILNKKLSEETIAELQKNLNASQPQTDNDHMTRSLLQYLYRKNPTNFCRFLMMSRLSHLILWTEAKCIVRHFGLQGVVYVRWNDNEYECSMHKNAGNNTQGDVGEFNEFENSRARNTFKPANRVKVDSESNDSEPEAAKAPQ